MSDDTILNADEFQALCLQDAILATDRYEALRDEVERLTERDQCAVQRSITASEVVLLERAKAAEAEVKRLRTDLAATVDDFRAEKLRDERKRVAALTEALAAIAEGRWNVDTGRTIDARTYARAVLGGTETP